MSCDTSEIDTWMNNCLSDDWPHHVYGDLEITYTLLNHIDGKMSSGYMFCSINGEETGIMRFSEKHLWHRDGYRNVTWDEPVPFYLLKHKPIRRFNNVIQPNCV